MAKSNGWKIVAPIGLAVGLVFGLVYFLHAQQQTEIKENRNSTQEAREDIAEVKGDIKYLIRIMETSLDITPRGKILLK